MNEMFMYYLLYGVLVVSGIVLGMHISDRRCEHMKSEALRMGNESYYVAREDWEENKDDVRN